MEVGNYLIKYQPIAYRIFSNAIKSGKIAHAYMLLGEPGIPLKEIAIHLAKSIVCDNPNPLACNSCLTCMRIDDGNYADIKILDGANKTIKKPDVEEITENFAKTAFEEKGIMVYVLHLVENMTVEAVNSILKFLEEPGKSIYAILTTENESKVLPTILSRAQGIRFKLIKKEIIIDEAIGLGVPAEDAELLANFYNNSELLKDKYQDKTYIQLKELLINQLKALTNSKEEAIYFAEKEVIPMLKSKELARTYLDMLTISFQDITNIKIGKLITLKSYDTIIKDLSNKLSHLDKSLLTIMNSRTTLDMNLNIGLLIDKMMIKITEE